MLKARRTKISEKGKNLLWLKLSILLFIFSGITLLFYKTGLINFFLDKQRIVTFLHSLGPFAIIGFILIQALQVVIAPIPGEVTGLLGGYLYGNVLGIIYSTIGLSIGSYIAFAISRVYGGPLVEKFVSKSTIERFEYLLHHKGAFLVFLLFLIPGIPKDALCYILGLGHLSTKEFIVISGTGRLFGTALLTLGGDYIRHHQYYRFFILIGIAIIVVFFVMAYKDKIERLLRAWHVTENRKKKKENRSQ